MLCTWLVRQPPWLGLGFEQTAAGATLRLASVDAAEAAFWGGIDIRVPRGWRIENDVTAILGGIVDKTDRDVPAGSPTLMVRGIAIMGGVEIKHPKG